MRIIGLLLVFLVVTNTALCQRVRVLDNFETLSGWTSGSNSLTLDNEEVKEGLYALKSEGSNMLRYAKTLTTPFDASLDKDDGYFCLSLFVSDITKLSGSGQIELSSGGKADFYETAWGFSSINLKNGWNDLVFKLSTGSKTPGAGGGETDFSAINFVRIHQGSSASVIFKVDNMRFTDFYDNGHVKDPNFHIYLLAGQSNMSGRGKLTDLYEDTMSTYADISSSRIKVLNADNEWVAAKHPLHYDYTDAAVGPGLDFALKMLANESPDVTIGLIPTAVGGSNIDHWQPGQVLYNRAVPKTIIASTDGVLKGVLFHQGEANVFDSTYSTWPAKVKNVISGFRKEFKDPQLKFLIGELGYYRSEFKNLNILIPDLVATTPYTYMVSAESLEHKGDNLHFSSASATTLGIRYAQALQNAVSPVDFLDFSINTNTNGNHLIWTTTNEKNNDHFEIERSASGTQFNRIGEVKSSPNNNKIKTYTFTDASIPTGTSYYRIKQVNHNGTCQYSKSLKH